VIVEVSPHMYACGKEVRHDDDAFDISRCATFGGLADGGFGEFEKSGFDDLINAFAANLLRDVKKIGVCFAFAAAVSDEQESGVHALFILKNVCPVTPVGLHWCRHMDQASDGMGRR
jgi:hypothetical protein